MSALYTPVVVGSAARIAIRASRPWLRTVMGRGAVTTGMDSDGRADHVETVFPELEEIADQELREKTIAAWVLAMEENGVQDLTTVPWLPPDQERLELGEERLVDHVREVVTGGLLLAELLNDRRDVGIDTDIVVAGGLLHDVSKLYEFHGFEETAIHDLLGHPYYGIYVTGSVDLPPELVAITVNHTPVTNVDPASMEAALVSWADHASAMAIWDQGVSDLRELR